MLDEFYPGRVWTRRIDLTFYGFQMGTRMTVVCMNDGRLLVHSPSRLDADLVAAVESLGPVAFVIAPNKLHHLFVGEWQGRYPEARYYCSPGLVKKRPDLRWDGVLDDFPEPEWAEEIDQALIKGSLYMDEVVFFDRNSKTLIVTDLLERADESWGGPVQCLLGHLAGIWHRHSLTRDQRLLFTDREALRHSIDRVRGWKFDNIILSHGTLVKGRGADVFDDAFKWLE
jgi:hypothetical protein